MALYNSTIKLSQMLIRMGFLESGVSSPGDIAAVESGRSNTV